MDRYYARTEQLHCLVQSLTEKVRLQMNDTKVSNCQLETANEEMKIIIEELKRENQSLHRDTEEQNRESSLRIQKQLANHQRLSRQLFDKIAAANESKQIMLRIHESEIKKMRQAHKEEIAHLLIKMEDTKQDYASVRDEKGTVEAQLTKLSYDNDMLSSELNQARTTLKEHISESTSAANAANRKIQRLIAIQSGMMSSVRELEFTKKRFRNLTEAIDAALCLSKENMVDEVGIRKGKCGDDMQSRLLDLQMLLKRIANLHKSRQLMKKKLKRVDRFWRDNADEWHQKIEDLEQRNSSMKEDLEMFGWNEDDSQAILERKAKSLEEVAVELQCVQLQQHVEALRASIEQKDSEISKLRRNLTKSEHEIEETRRLHCSGVLLLSNQLMLMGGSSSPKSMFIADELQKMPHHSHFDWKMLPPPQVDLKKATIEQPAAESATYLGPLDRDVIEETLATEPTHPVISTMTVSQKGTATEASPNISQMQRVRGLDLNTTIADSVSQYWLKAVGCTKENEQQLDDDEETFNGEEAMQTRFDHLKLEITSSYGGFESEKCV